MRRTLAVLAVTTLALTACAGGAGDSVGPGSLAGTYSNCAGGSLYSMAPREDRKSVV